MAWHQIVFFIMLVAACAYAGVRGGMPERIVAVALFAAAFLTRATGRLLFGIHTYHSLHIDVLIVDVLLMMVLGAVAMRSARFWPMAMASMQGAVLLGHVARPLTADIVPPPIMRWSLSGAFRSSSCWRWRRSAIAGGWRATASITRGRPTFPNPTEQEHAPMSAELRERALRLIETRRGIADYFDPRLFADPARDILLALFAAGEEGQPADPGRCAAIAQVPETTARRWVTALESEGLVTADATLRLTERGRTAMAGYLASLA